MDSGLQNVDISSRGVCRVTVSKRLRVPFSLSLGGQRLTSQRWDPHQGGIGKEGIILPMPVDLIARDRYAGAMRVNDWTYRSDWQEHYNASREFDLGLFPLKRLYSGDAQNWFYASRNLY